jgi:amino acid adenylation domain-containing protein/thioester reductase-like protein
MDYGSLEDLSNKLAAYLREDLGVRRGARVGICIEPSPLMVIALLAVLKAGGAYVPLDADLPKQRLSYILSDADVGLVLVQRKFCIDIAMCAGDLRLKTHLIELDGSWQHASEESIRALPDLSPDDLAYVLYTTGSTGEPKGVMIEHRGVLCLAQTYVDLFGICERTRMLQFASLSFDAATGEIFPALAGGATLVLSPREDIIPGRALATFLAHKRISMICLPPSLLATLQSAMDDLPNLDTILVAGEACSAPVIHPWVGAGRRLFNAYGPTEGTVCATVYRIQGDEDVVPIGLPLPYVTVHIVDERMEEVPDGQRGELCIGGLGVARGYLGKPEQTARSFLPNPWEPGLLYKTGDLVLRRPGTGLLEFLGRKDNQVKVRGFRVELEAIERALCEHPAVQLAAVTVHEVGAAAGEHAKTLVGYVVPRPGVSPDQLSPDSLHRFLGESLPDYMIPPLFVLLDALPMMANRSKVNRAALPPPDNRPRRSGEETSLSRQMAILFDQALNLPLGSFRIDDHFFEKGGSSLGITQLLLAIKSEFGIRIPARQVYQHPTPANMATLVQTALLSPYRAAAAETVDLYQEAQRVAAVLPEQLSKPQRAPRSLLLTGATGFLGSFVLKSLKERAPGIERICLVRAPSVRAAEARLMETLRHYQIPTDVLRDTRILIGDLESATLGLDESTYAALADTLDSIYHCAADINYLKPYARMKGPNVDGTQNILRLVGSGRPKALHYVSSVGVFGACGGLLGIQQVDEDYNIDRSAPILSFENGYIRSKWVAESLVRSAQERGLAAWIYRPGFIEGSSQTGVANVTDSLCRTIIGCIQLGSYPLFPEKYWLPIPVDFVADALVHISLSANPDTYHLIPDHDREVSHNEMFRIINELGYRVEPLPPHKWFEQLASCPPENALYPITSFLLERVHEGRNTLMELHHRTPLTLNEKTHRALAGSGITIPDFGRELIQKYLTYYAAIGLLPQLDRSPR